MARKEIKIFMDSKEVSNFLKVIDWSWLFTFLSERYNVSLSPRKELKELHNGAAIIKVEWPDELIEKCGMMADVFSSVKLATFGWNPELLAQIADCTAALLATNGISSHFPSANTEPICSWEKPVVEYQRPDYALEYGTNY